MSIDTNYAVLSHLLSEHEIDGWAAEFGVYSGYSLEMIAAHVPVIGFDSFEGLPEDWRDGFPKGTFSTNGVFESDGIWTDGVPPNAMIVPGWFSDTVPTFPFPRLGLVHIDCDLYSSTVTALEGVKNAIGPGTYIVFDEFQGYPGWEDHEAKAWKEFCAVYEITATDLMQGEQERCFQIDRMGRTIGLVR